MLEVASQLLSCDGINDGQPSKRILSISLSNLKAIAEDFKQSATEIMGLTEPSVEGIEVCLIGCTLRVCSVLKNTLSQRYSLKMSSIKKPTSICTAIFFQRYALC